MPRYEVTLSVVYGVEAESSDDAINEAHLMWERAEAPDRIADVEDVQEIEKELSTDV